jgi:hypothetical protein
MFRQTVATPAYRGGKTLRGENYFLAEMVAGRVGDEQAAPRKEFD